MNTETAKLWERVSDRERLSIQTTKRFAVRYYLNLFKNALLDLSAKKEITKKMLDEFVLIVRKVNKQMQEYDAFPAKITFDDETMKLWEEALVQRELYAELLRHETTRDCMIAARNAIIDTFHKGVLNRLFDVKQWPVVKYILDNFSTAFEKRLQKDKKGPFTESEVTR